MRSSAGATPSSPAPVPGSAVDDEVWEALRQDARRVVQSRLEEVQSRAALANSPNGPSAYRRGAADAAATIEALLGEVSSCWAWFCTGRQILQMGRTVQGRLDTCEQRTHDQILLEPDLDRGTAAIDWDDDTLDYWTGQRDAYRSAHQLIQRLFTL